MYHNAHKLMLNYNDPNRKLVRLILIMMSLIMSLFIALFKVFRYSMPYQENSVKLILTLTYR